MRNPKFDLEERPLAFSVRVIRVTESMKRSRAANHSSDQLLRAGTYPYGNRGEAEGTESRNEFIHKLKICYEKLRESRRWLKLVQRASLITKPDHVDGLIAEADERVRIFASSIRTAQSNGGTTT